MNPLHSASIATEVAWHAELFFPQTWLLPKHLGVPTKAIGAWDFGASGKGLRA